MIPRLAPVAGLAGAIVLGIASLLTALAYRGTKGESYVPFSHFVSELGERGVSELAGVFNAGLVAGGALFVLFALGLAMARRGRLRLAYGGLGVLAGLFGVGVGLFPMDTLGAHRIAAAGFFNVGWMMVAVASLDIGLRPEPRFPRWIAAAGAVTVAVFLAFIQVFSTDPLSTANRFGAPDPRPAFWWVVTLEWASIVALLGWVAAVSVVWLRHRSAREARQPA